MVKLKTDKMDKPQEFGFDHAQKILSMTNNGGWELADNNFKIDDDGNITKRTKQDNREN